MAEQKTNKNKKYGRNSASCKIYRLQGRHNKNKTHRLLTLLRTQPRNEQLPVALRKLNVATETIKQHGGLLNA